MHTITYPSSQPAANKFVRDTWKREASHFRTFITHIIWYLHLQCVEREYNYRGKREGSALSVPRMRHIHIHNDRFWQQCQPQTILCHIYLSSVERYSDSGSQWWMRHRPTPDTYFPISRTNNTDIWNEYRCLKKHRQQGSLGRHEEADTLYTRKHTL